jgi:hypothetical protein
LGFNQNGIEKNTTDSDGNIKTESQSLFGILYYLYSQLKNNKDLTGENLSNISSIFDTTKEITLDGIDSDQQKITDNIFKNYLVNKNTATQKVKLEGYTTEVTYPVHYPTNPEQCDQNKQFNSITSRVINFDILYPVLTTMIETLNQNLKTIDTTIKDKIKEFIQKKDNNYLIFMIYRIISDFISVILCPYKSDGNTYITQKKTIRNFGKYIMFYYKRTSYEVNDKGKRIKYNYGIDINEQINSNGKKYVLVGFTCHYGGDSDGGHYDCVKCDEKGKPILEISDTTISIYNRSEDKLRGVVAVIYKRVDEDQTGLSGGSKPTHNTTAYKSKHNSSFKSSSSSKSKAKSHSHSHTRRVR